MTDPLTVLRDALNEGYHKGGHHPNCATKTDEGCDCYARSRLPQREALADIEALVEAARDQYEQVQMDESVGICLTDRVTTLRLGEALARFSQPDKDTPRA